jgi:hypothetical protein
MLMFTGVSLVKKVKIMIEEIFMIESWQNIIFILPA